MKVRKRKQMKTDNSAKKVNSVKKERREKKENITTIISWKCIVYSSGRCDGMVYPFPFFVD